MRKQNVTVFTHVQAVMATSKARAAVLVIMAWALLASTTLAVKHTPGAASDLVNAGAYPSLKF